MLDRRLVAGGAAVGLVAVAMVAFVLFSPRWAVGTLDQLAQQQLGRSVVAKGHAGLDVSPLSIRITDASLSGAGRGDDSFVTARSMVIPVTLGELLRRRPNLASFALEGAEFALLINERGEANWDFPDLAARAPMRITLRDSAMRYFDARNSQSLTLANANGVLELREDGGAAFSGTAVIKARLVRIDAELKSLPRVNEDGSPLELSLSNDLGSASFSGRLSTAKVLSLTGPLGIQSPSPVAALQFIGLPVPEGTTAAGPLELQGGLDSAGRAYAVRNATLSLGGFRAAGDMVADLRNERPKLQANLMADTLWLDGFVPASGASGSDWGRKQLPFALLRSLDAEASLEARSLAYGPFSTGPGRLQAVLADGKLDVTAAAQLANGGTASLGVKADATAAPPSVDLTLDARDTEAQPLFTALMGASQITGNGSFAASLSATGHTQEELTGTLKGTASLNLANGRIAGSDLAGLFIAARQKILDGWKAAPGNADFTSLAGEAAIADGIASFRGVSLVTPQASFTLEGLVDLLRQGVEVSATAEANGQPLLPVPLIARGAWGAPRIYPDIPNILTNPEGGFARLQDAAPAQGN